MVVGTAGHVDHGKTTLVRALTGVDTDRLPEEKRRGITIELGFAPMVVDGETISIVDVPGHERFVGTMASGAQGVDVALLVVAADAGVMPQTREHLLVLGALGVRALIVALTRIDLADAETRALAKLDVEAALEETPWKNAPIYEASGKSGEGVEALKRALVAATKKLDLSARKARPARLAIDRAFVPRGQGVVVTGTLVDGEIAVGDPLTRLPNACEVRVRGLHQHGRAVERASAGGRLAIALGGVELAEVHRGDTLAAPGSMTETRVFDAIFTRSKGGRPIGRRARVSVHAGTAETPGRIVPLAALEEEAEIETTIAGGDVRLVRVLVEHPIVIAAGDRLVVRGDARVAATGTTLGGLEVLRVAPGKMHGRVAYAETLRTLARGDAAARARFEIEAAGVAGIAEESLAPRLQRRAIGKDVARAIAAWEVRGASRRWVGEAARARVRAALIDALAAYHRAHPDEEGAPIATVSAAAPANAAPGLVDATIERAIAEKLLFRAGDRLRLASFTARARVDDPTARSMAKALAEAKLAPPTLTELASTMRIDPARARALAQALATTGEIVHVQGDLWFSAAALAELRTRLVAYLEREGSITTGAFKEMVGASRKFVVPLAEWFDAQRVTLRVGDARKLRK